MKKYLIFFLFVMTTLSVVFAGDSAVLVDSGFSSDGNYYVFGQYGRIDGKFQGWADIYTIDVQKNDYVKGGVFAAKPSSETENKTGKALYEELSAKNNAKLSVYKCNPAKPDKILYIREEEKKNGTDEIVFKDFVTSIGKSQADYYVQLLPEITGKGVNSVSSFVIMMEKRNADGKVLARQKIGSPNVRRNGVSAYKIERIVCDNTGTKLAFIIEKTVNDKTGTNIRYMIETCVLNDDFTNGVIKTSEIDVDVKNVKNVSEYKNLETIKPVCTDCDDYSDAK